MSGGKGGSQTVGYKYHVGGQFILGLCPWDKIIEIKVGDRVAWLGSDAGDIAASVSTVSDYSEFLGVATITLAETLSSVVANGDEFDWSIDVDGAAEATSMSPPVANQFRVAASSISPHIRTITWTSGANDGQNSTVSDYSESLGIATITLTASLPSVVSTGDEFDWDIVTQGTATADAMSPPVANQFEIAASAVSPMIKTITWTSGANDTEESTVSDYSESLGIATITLTSSLPSVVSDGDQFDWAINASGSATAQAVSPPTGNQFTTTDEVNPLVSSITWTSGANGPGGGVPEAPGYGRININAPELFGGDGREGGIVGAVDVGMGYPSQPRNGYLLSKLGDMISAYRGVVSLILRQVYVGNNPYLKPWAVTGQRIYVRGIEGRPQWYPEKAGIFSGNYDAPTAAALNFSIDRSGSMFPSLSTRFETVKTAMGEVFDWIVASGLRHDIRVALWGSAGNTISITRRAADEADIDEIRDFINTATAEGGTDFTAALEGVESFFDGSGTLTRKFIFLTDGVPSPMDPAVNSDAAAALLFDIDGVQAHAFSIDLTDVQYTRKLDNTAEDGVPVVSGSNASAIRDALIATIKGVYLDMNPIHIIRECLTEFWGRNLPESIIGPSYADAADQCYEEGLGLSLLWAREQPVSEFIDEIQRYIDSVRYEDPETGLQKIKLIRGDYDIETLLVLSPSNSELLQFSRPPVAELANQVTIKYWNRDTGEDSSITLQDTAAINQLGTIVNQTFEYPGITSDTVATMVGNRDLARVSKPFARGQIRVLRSVANLKPGDVFVLNAPEEEVTQMICRVAKRREQGLRNGYIVLDFGEDVFAEQHTIYSPPPPSSWGDPIGQPQPLDRQTALELPFFLLNGELGNEAVAQLDPGAAFYALAAARPASGVHVNYRLWVYPDGTGPETDPELGETADFTPVCTVSVAADPDETVLTISGLTDTDSIRTGQLILVGGAGDEQRELIALTGELGDTITVQRGVADTIPRPIAQGTVLYFIEAFLGTSAAEFTDGETVEGYGAPVNGKGKYPGPYTYLDVDMQGRQYRPYPAANFRVDGILFPDESYSTSAPVLTWNHRDRLLQADQVVTWFEAANYGPEAGTTYRVESDAYDAADQLIQANWFVLDVGLTGTYTLDTSIDEPPANTFKVVIRVITVRDGVDSLQWPEVKITLFTAPFNLDYEYIPD